MVYKPRGTDPKKMTTVISLLNNMIWPCPSTAQLFRKCLSRLRSNAAWLIDDMRAANVKQLLASVLASVSLFTL
jgi:hypothetical protein